MVRNQSWPLTDSIRDRELAFAMQAIRKCASNECAWNYLSAFLGEGDGKVSLAVSVKAKSFSFLNPGCRFLGLRHRRLRCCVARQHHGSSHKSNIVFATGCTRCIVEVIHAAENQGPSCCFAIQALANIHEESAVILHLQLRLSCL